MASSRERILARLNDVSSSRVEHLVVSTFQAADLWGAFESQLSALGGKLISPEELRDQLGRQCYIELAAMEMLVSLGVIAETFEELPEPDIWDVEVGVSVADFAIAETGSLAVSSDLGRRRMSSLVPGVNVMLVKRTAIVGLLSEAIPLISRRSSALITGPSRTADIEGILVRGVHGPGELLVYVYD